MDFGVLGTGMVGQALATKLVSLGHTVVMGSRDTGNPHGREWAAGAGARASAATFSTAAAAGEIVINATNGKGALAALHAAGESNLDGKTVIDVSNPLDFESGPEPTLFIANTDSLGEQLQRAFPRANMVKSLNTLNCLLMVDPTRVPGDHNVFVNGNSEAAKAQTVELLQQFGWPASRIIDLGDITASRATEAALLLWLRVMRHYGTVDFNFGIQTATPH